MDDIVHMRKRLERALREARNAENELGFRETQMQQQKKHLDTLLDYRDECVGGLKSAKESGLTIVQMREYQLLLQHLSAVVEEQQYKVDLSQKNYEQVREVYEEKSQQLEKMRKTMEEMEQARLEQVVGEDEDSTTDVDVDGTARRRDASANKTSGIAGKRLKTGSG